MRIRYDIAKFRPGSLTRTGQRAFIYPHKVRGWFRKRRTWIEWLLILIFFLLPIIRIGGHPAVWLNVSERVFHLFGFTFFATDAPLLFPLLAGFFVALMAMTAIYGRLWCGWLCPQTVVIDLIYRRIEEWIEGDARQRKQLDAAPFNQEKVFKKSIKWASFTLISLLLGHAFIAYFVSWEGWIETYTRDLGSSYPSLVATVIFSLIFLIDFGWFREQFCMVACPYGRWQTVWLDEQSMIIDYASWRGEPRRGSAQPGEKQGDCVSCYHCVQSCPTGVDIRYGVQMECIACSACIDACDEVMLSLGKEPGLIRYTSYSQLRDPKSRHKPFRFAWRVRPFVYLGGLALIFISFCLGLYLRNPIWVSLRRPPGPLYLVNHLPSGATEVVNTFKISLRNQLQEPVRIETHFSQFPELSLVSTHAQEAIQPGEKREFLIFAKLNVGPHQKLVPSRDVPLLFEIIGVKSHKKRSLEKVIRLMSP